MYQHMLYCKNSKLHTGCVLCTCPESAENATVATTINKLEFHRDYTRKKTCYNWEFHV